MINKKIKQRFNIKFLVKLKKIAIETSICYVRRMEKATDQEFVCWNGTRSFQKEERTWNLAVW
jgi:hypothetical protein